VAISKKDSGGVAYWYVDGWKQAPGADVFVNAPVIGKRRFDKLFPDLPPIPAE